jgi:hypothetical protein
MPSCSTARWCSARLACRLTMPSSTTPSGVSIIKMCFVRVATLCSDCLSRLVWLRPWFYWPRCSVFTWRQP